jgi:integron-associated effector binding protein
MSEPVVVDREALEVQFVASRTDEIEEIRRAWEELESVVDLPGRRFYGAYYPYEKEYRACVAIREGDQPVPGLATGTLPGGQYLRARLSGEPPAVYDQIRPTFEGMLERAKTDPGRPSLELYRRRDEIELLLPIL